MLEQYFPVLLFILFGVIVGVVLLTVGKDYAAVRSTLSHPLVSILMLLFIGSSIVHMRIGMQVIIEDYVHGGLRVILQILNTFFAILVAAASLFAIVKLSFGA